MTPQPNPNRFSFKEVAKQTGTSGLKLAEKKFRDQAGEALKKKGFGEIETKAILKGTRTLRPEKLKRVFQTLRNEHLIKKGRQAVTTFVQKEKSRQREAAKAEQSVSQQHLRERLREKIMEAEQENPAMAPLPATISSVGQPVSSVANIPVSAPEEAPAEEEKDEISELRQAAEEKDLPIT